MNLIKEKGKEKKVKLALENHLKLDYWTEKTMLEKGKTMCWFLFVDSRYKSN